MSSRKKQPLEIIFFSITLLALAFTILLIVRRLQGYLISPALLVIMGGITLLCLAATRLSSKFKVNLLMLLISTVLTLYMVEFFLFFVGNPFDKLSTHAIAAFKSGKPFDARRPLDVVNDLETEGTITFPFISPSNFVDNMPLSQGKSLYALSGISNAKTVYCNELGEFIIYDSDRYGFRNTSEIWNEPPMQVTVVGDSFAHGACVPDKSTIAGVIRANYPKTLNLGASGNGPLSTLATIKEYVAPVTPKVVVWVYFEGNDLGDLQKESKNQLLMSYVEDNFSQNLNQRQIEIDQARFEYLDNVEQDLTDTAELFKARRPMMFWASVRLYQVRKLLGLTFEQENQPPAEPQQKKTKKERDVYRARIMPPRLSGESSISYQEEKTPPPDLGDNYQANLELMYKILQDANYFTQSWGGQLYFVYIPDYIRYSAEPPAEDTMGRTDILKMVKTLDIPMIDLYPVLKAEPDPLALYPFRMDGHFDEVGYELIGKTILERIAPSLKE